LRTPLNSIIGFTGILMKQLVGPLNDEQIKQLGMVRSSSVHLLDLINDVLDISKIEAGQVTIVRREFNLRISVEKIVESALPLADKKQLKVMVAIAPGIGPVVSDQRRVEQILLNLINNAIKFTEKGSVSIRCDQTGDQIIIDVTDTGIGIKDEDMDKLFNAFQQIDSGITRKYEGTGLGLSICKKFAEMLGGKIAVTSTWGKGSSFRFTLPKERKCL
jgi:signal transduction histidine kinase